MNRREFLIGGAVVAGTALANAACCRVKSKDAACAGAQPGLKMPKEPAKFNLCLQWGAIPVADDFNAKLDYLEANGYSAVEIPTGKRGEWVLEKGEAFHKAMQNRKLFCATACGPSRFDYADKAKNEAEVAKFMPVLEILGAIKSVGLILCPARKKPEVGLKELREDFVTNTGKRLAEKAAACGTKIVLEPLQRKETPFLRQVADGAKMAQEMGPGATVMGDFWHMSKEEPNFFGPFMSAGALLSHVHIASLGTRKIPGSDGALDNYVEGFTALKLLGYQGAVSMEAGWVPKGKDAKGKPILPGLAERHQILTRMCAMLREQWARA